MCSIIQKKKKDALNLFDSSLSQPNFERNKLWYRGERCVENGTQKGWCHVQHIRFSRLCMPTESL